MSTTKEDKTKPKKYEEIDFTKLKIKFIEYKKKCKGETKSKFLDPESELFFHIFDCQERLKHAGIRFESRLDPHIELVTNSDTLETFLSRSKQIHNQEVDVTKKESYKIIGRNLVFKLPFLVDNKEFHIKIAYFNYLPPHIDKLTTLILEKDYSPYSEWEQTVFD